MKTTFNIRLSEAEKKAFHDAAKASGISLAAWMRERLRRAAVKELAQIGIIAEFLDDAKDLIDG